MRTIEQMTLDWLSEQLEVPAFMEVPEHPPVEFLVVEKTSGGESNHLNTATLVVQSYAGTLYQASQLNERMKRAMADMITLDEVTRVKLNSDYNFTDTATKRYRYQAVFDLVFY